MIPRRAGLWAGSKRPGSCCGGDQSARRMRACIRLRKRRTGFWRLLLDNWTRSCRPTRTDLAPQGISKRKASSASRLSRSGSELLSPLRRRRGLIQPHSACSTISGPDEVYSLAAQSHVRVSFDIPEYTVDVTAVGALACSGGFGSLGRMTAPHSLTAASRGPLHPTVRITIVLPES